jgi:two-component system chemotaxis response regulator CheB
LNPDSLRVLVVDDSPSNRRNIIDILESSDIEVVGKAADGEEALRLALSLKPDVITLDLEMPKMDGFTFLRILMAKQPTPVIVISSYANKENVFKALEFGAIDFIAKPEQKFGSDGPLRREIVQKVQLVRNLKPVGVSSRLGASSASGPASAAAASAAPISQRSPQAMPVPQPRQLPVPLRHIVAIASSTGGPSALIELLAHLPERFPAAILIAQHMPEKFTRTFAERLDRKGPLRAMEAYDGVQVVSRTVYICPGKMCMDLTVVPGTGAGILGELRLRVTPPAPADRYVPSADRLFSSVADIAGTRAVGIILTGMGDDGVYGARAIRNVHGPVIAESEETAVVYGMPGSAVKAGVVSDILPLQQIGVYLSILGQ